VTDPVEAFRQRTKDRLASEINDPFSDRSGYGDPDLFAALLDEYDRSPGYRESLAERPATADCEF
jgi:hypothetical protein